MATIFPKPMETQMYARLRTVMSLLKAQMTSNTPLMELDAYRPILYRLRGHEKHVLYELYKECEWDVGAGYVYDCLQTSGIITISRYLYNVATRHERLKPSTSADTLSTIVRIDLQRQQDEQLCENVLNEILDNCPTLLLQLIEGNLQCSHRRAQLLSERLDAAVGRLIFDLHDIVSMPFHSYFRALAFAPVPKPKMDAFRAMHYRHILRLDATPTRLAIGQLPVWLARRPNDEFYHLWQMMRQVVGPATSGVCLRLLASVQQPDFSGWCWWLCMWSALVRHPAAADSLFAAIRSKLSEWLRRFVQTGRSMLLYEILIVARTTAHYARGQRQFGEYTRWFERTLGDVAYKQTADEFRTIVDALTAMLADERDAQMLSAHLSVHMTAPLQCNHLVLKWKAATRARIAVLQKENEARIAVEETTEAATSAPTVSKSTEVTLVVSSKTTATSDRANAEEGEDWSLVDEYNEEMDQMECY